MYEIALSETAAKEIEKLPKDLQDRIIAVLERININPYHNVKKLVGSEAYRIRVGKYRIILDINEKLKRIEVLRVGKRDSIYL